MYKIVINGNIIEASTIAELTAAAQAFAQGAPKQGTGAKAPATKQAVTKEPKAPKLFSVELKDYEPKRGKDGEYVWQSYKAQRSHYCYAVVTKGLAKDSEGAFQLKLEVDYEGAWPKAKAEFEAAYKYIRKADRK